MERYFNTEGCCRPQEHYMVNLESRLAEIKKMVDAGKYFTINRGRQYGKTTTLEALQEYLKDDYIVISMDFQWVSISEFETEENFVKAFSRELWRQCKNIIPSDLMEQVKAMRMSKEYMQADLFLVLSEWCDISEKPIVLIIDEVDQASNNQVFLDFLAQLRGYYLKRNRYATFQSVILAGVHDIRNLRQKIRPDVEHKHNSPWNIAANFDVEMSFSVEDIVGMLKEYEADKQTGMDISAIANLIYDYTSGYPVLVSHICKLNDEKLDASIRWTREGVVQAVGQIVKMKHPLFESLINKLEDDENLKNCVHAILIHGDKFSYNPDDASMELAAMYGFIKSVDDGVQIANRIFEIRLYNAYLMSKEMQANKLYKAGTYDKSQFISGGILDMEKILERFVIHFNDIFGDKPEHFKEEQGREHFLLYLRPIINGTGNFYIEPQTRDHKRMDVVVDYLGLQYIIELKIRHGEEYNLKGENQLCGYLDRHHLNKGYLLSFCFNQKKESGVHTVQVDGKIIVEAIV